MSQSSIVIGQVIGNYRVVKELGRGGMGAVFEAVHQQIERRAAIKVLHPYISRDPAQATRFLNEARAVNIISHPNLIDIYEMGSLPDGSAYIVMEFLGGTSLKDRLRFSGGRIGPAGLRFARQIASGLCAAHEKGIVHRDLKPDNVMIVGDPELPAGERVKIFDFGIARMEAGPGKGPQAPEGLLGTPAYMSPEQCRGDGEIGPRADVYALGVILYHFLAGHPPFSAPSVVALLTLHLMQEPPPLRDVDPDLPPRLVDLVHAMLRKDPETRPSMSEVAATLERMSVVAPGQPLPPRPQVALYRRRRVLLLAACGTLFLLLGTGAFLAQTRRAPHPDPAPMQERRH